MQQQLFEIQKKPEAWGLILPLLDHPDPNVEFFGAHTAQVKIVRDWYVAHPPKFLEATLNRAMAAIGTPFLKNMPCHSSTYCSLRPTGS